MSWTLSAPKWARLWLELRTNRRAVTALEYGLIGAAIAAVIAGAAFALGGTVHGLYSAVSSSL